MFRKIFKSSKLPSHRACQAGRWHFRNSQNVTCSQQSNVTLNTNRQHFCNEFVVIASPLDFHLHSITFQLCLAMQPGCMTCVDKFVAMLCRYSQSADMVQFCTRSKQMQTVDCPSMCLAGLSSMRVQCMN